jgi:serine/threonine protein kinase
MGIVYRAMQTGLKRPVALKMIPPGIHVRPDDLIRFRLEAESAARIQHPHVVQVFEIGSHQGRLWFAMELVPGGSLFEQLPKGYLPVRETARMIEATARGIHAAHMAGVIHRDLKPGNILLTLPAAGERLGQPKISDFGLARQGGRADLTALDAVIGTPGYMAPEQAEGRNRDVGPAADIWSLGAILYECLAGRAPFQGDTPTAILDQVRFSEPLAPSRFNPAVPPELEAICRKCLCKDPTGRYRSAAVLADDLRRFLSGESLREAGPPVAVFATLPASGGDVTNPGELLPLGYRSVSELARHGARAVYQAWQSVPGRHVCLTVRAHQLNPSDQRLTAWRAATSTLARLQHPHLTRIWQWGEERGLAFHSEEWLDNGTLEDRLEGDPWAPRPAAELILTLARALALTQPLGVCHGRLIPSRIRLAGRGEQAVPKIRGFAALSPGAALNERDPDFVYLAPEVRAGGEPVPASDVYSLGVLLFHLFSGKLPGTGPAPPGVPSSLKGLVLLCMQTKPERRIVSAAALADEIAHFLDDIH